MNAPSKRWSAAAIRGARALSVGCTAGTAVVVELLVRCTSLPRACQFLGVQCVAKHGASSPVRAVSADTESYVRRVYTDVDRLYRRSPLPDTCLRRSLTAGFRLRALKPRLVIGVKKRAPAVQAHAWLVLNGNVLDWANKHHEYTPICVG